ncbi:MAG: hypothetical protein MZV49_02395 [Rhodopseudomonas palustris]|nr:hypothetical protein [Rhodopseudomonas palustris]
MQAFCQISVFGGHARSAGPFAARESSAKDIRKANRIVADGILRQSCSKVCRRVERHYDDPPAA